MRRFCERRPISPVGNCCAVRGDGSSIVQPPRPQANTGRRAKMATGLPATIPVRMGFLRPDFEGEEGDGHRIEVDAWEHLHLSKAREVELTVIRVTRFGESSKKRDPRVSWVIWIDQEPAPLAEIRPLYQRRFGMEHTYRFQ